MKKTGTIIGGALFIVAAVFGAIKSFTIERLAHFGQGAEVYNSNSLDASTTVGAGGAIFTNASTTTASSSPAEAFPPPFIVTHILTPDPVRAVYYTSWAAGSPSFRKGMNAILATSSEVNSVVIDVKDYSGRIGYIVNDPALKDPLIEAIGSPQNRIPDIERYIGALHDKGIYVIGRIQSFEDPFATTVKPEWAVKDALTGKRWKDAGGAYWLDSSNHEVWDYLVAIAKQAYGAGFDEINFDYVRFPSDGAVGETVYSKSASTTKAEVITELFSYLHDRLSGAGIPISADLFGQTTSDEGDMGIGQVIENAFPYFDFVDPMVYPSHYVKGFIGYAKPAEHPYEIVKYSMDRGIERALAISESPGKLRPWLQAFDLGATYTPDMVNAQIRATYGAGLESWMLWNAGSIYSRYTDALSDTSALLPASGSTTIAILEKKAEEEREAKAADAASRQQAAVFMSATTTMNAATTSENIP